MSIPKSVPQPNNKAERPASDTVFVAHPSFREAFRFWLKLGFISFGGPAGQISIMYQELVEKRRWVSNERFLNALNYCMLLPGPEAQQLAAYIGWLLHRIPGGIVAGMLFLLPSMVILYALFPEPVFYKEGFFFTKAAFLTFGGAYAVLAYIAQAGVGQFSWQRRR